LPRLVLVYRQGSISPTIASRTRKSAFALLLARALQGLDDPGDILFAAQQDANAVGVGRNPVTSTTRSPGMGSAARSQLGLTGAVRRRMRVAVRGVMIVSLDV
jgi:hypothetical protein